LALRTPIVSVVGHVDHGKTTLLDTIRGSRVVKKEAGGITQHIGATEIPIDVIMDISKKLSRTKVTIPGLLFIDTPGHHAFTNLRRRGSALADLAVLVVDINEGFKPQTHEAINILKALRTPFVVAANKIDRIAGWQSFNTYSFIESFNQQEDMVKTKLEEQLYELIGELYSTNFQAERFDRITDFQRTVCVVPISAKTGEGVAELLMILVGLAQKFLEDNLKLHVSGKARGTVLEIKEERGIGLTMDAILYDGTLHTGDKLIIGGIEEPVITHVKGIFKPREMAEMRVESKFKKVDEVSAAAGIKIVAQDIENVLAGSEFSSVEKEEDIEEFLKEMKKEYESIKIETDEEGIIVKADAIGSLEAIINELRNENIPIRIAEVGNITKRDVIEAGTVKNPLLKVIIGFNVKILPGVEEEASTYDVRIFHGNVIYKLIEDFKEWEEEEQKKIEKMKVETIIRPGKIELLPDFIFRRSKPAIAGVRVLGGELRNGVKLMKTNGTVVGQVKGIQDRGENVGIAKTGSEVAVSIDGVMIGRQIKEDEILYVDIPEKHAKILETDLAGSMTSDEMVVFEEFLNIKRRNNPFWGK